MSPEGAGGTGAAPRRILVATRSPHKLGELQALLHLDGTTLLSLDDVHVTGEPIEDAATFRGNAIIKARYYADRSGLPTLADDSGLEVDALGGQPGIRTRRYASEEATDQENNQKLLGELNGLSLERRRARYRCVLAYLDPRADDRSADRPNGRHAARRDPWVVTRSGTFTGRIALSPRGTNGFGYDPIFEPQTEPPGGRTVAQLSPEEKNRISHRARATRAMARYLRTHAR